MTRQQLTTKSFELTTVTEARRKTLHSNIRRRLFHLGLQSKSVISHRIPHSWSVDAVKGDDKQFKFYTGLTYAHFIILWEFLGPAAAKLTHWCSTKKSHFKNSGKSPSKCIGPARKLSPQNCLFLTLVRLRTGLLIADLAYRFKISSSTASDIFTTWIQFLYLQFDRIRDRMFPDRMTIKKSSPKCFRKFKNIRTIIDCSEFHVQSPRDFSHQGNLYSAYKSHTTFKILIGIAPNGAIVYVSDLFEGSISDKEIVSQSGFLDKLNVGDLILADRGFTIRDILYEKQVELNIPPFLHGREKFTPSEEIKTKTIAKLRIHVERAIERVKKFRLLSKTLPLSLSSVANQLVFVACCLVNFQDPLVT